MLILTFIDSLKRYHEDILIYSRIYLLLCAYIGSQHGCVDWQCLVTHGWCCKLKLQSFMTRQMGRSMLLGNCIYQDQLYTLRSVQGCCCRR